MVSPTRCPPLPVHSLMATMTATINNSTPSQNIQDTVPILLRMIDPEESARRDSMAPTNVGYVAHYEDGVEVMDFALGMGGAPGAEHPAIRIPDVVEHLGAADGGVRFTRPMAVVSHPARVLA